MHERPALLTANWNQRPGSWVLCGEGKNNLQGEQFSADKGINLET